jgi:transcription antitermination factor NusG
MPWFVLYTQPRNEKKVAERLEKLGIKAYCPMTIQVRQWSDRKKKVEVPLLNSYVFVPIET